MNETENMFWILTALTVGFSFLWVRTGGILFVSQFGERPRLRQTGHGLLRNDHGGLLFGNLLPLGSAVVASPWPLVVSPDGILDQPLSELATPATESPRCRFLSFDEIVDVRTEGRTLLVNGRPFVTCPSATLAKWWSRWLPALKSLPNAEREQSIRREASRSFDACAAGRTMNVCRRRTCFLRIVSLVLLVYCFGIFAAILLAGLSISLLHAIAIYGMLVVFNGMIFGFTAAKLCRKSPSETSSWMLLISPADAFHAADKLLRLRMERFHPTAVARSLRGSAAADPLVRRFKLELLHTPTGTPTGDRRIASVLTWHVDCIKAIAARELGGLDVDIPEREESATHYCRRCENQFVRPGECINCQLPLRPFSTTEPSR